MADISRPHVLPTRVAHPAQARTEPSVNALAAPDNLVQGALHTAPHMEAQTKPHAIPSPEPCIAPSRRIARDRCVAPEAPR